MSAPATSVPFEGGTSFLLTTCGSEVRKRWARVLSDHGLTSHHFALLEVLDHVGGASQKELASTVGIDPRNAPPLLDLLDSRDLITRADSTLDRRRQVIEITSLGRSIVGLLRTTGTEVENEYFAPLAPHERQELRRLLLVLASRANREDAAAETSARSGVRSTPRRPRLDDQPFLY